MIGKPKYKYEDTVGFYLKPYGETEQKFFVGKVYIIDAYGTFEQNEEPSYDIMVEDFNGTGRPCLVKHVRESECVEVNNTKIDDYIKEFQIKCKEISDRFGISDTMASCFICNYGKDSDICRDCSRKDECFNIAEQMNKMKSN